MQANPARWATIATLVRALGSLGDASSRELLISVADSHAGEPWLASRLQKLFADNAAAIEQRIGGGG